MVGIVRACPPALLAAGRRLLVAAQRLTQATLNRLALAAAATAADGSLAAAPCAPSPFTPDESALWELETELGLLRIDFDAATQRRTRMQCNSRAARIWGHHREEYLARFASHEGPCHTTDLGVLCAFVADFLAPRADCVVSYQRFSFGVGPSNRAALVRTRKTRVFDGLGRIVQVGRACRRYCRPFSAPAGAAAPAPRILFGQTGE